MSTNSLSSSSPGFSSRQQNSQYSPYVSPSVRQQGQRFNYHAPSPYPRPRSSASKPNPSLSGDDRNFPADNCSAVDDYYYRREMSCSNNSFGSSASDKNGRFNSSMDYGSGSEYYSCNEDSFRSPMISPHGNYQKPGPHNQQYSPFLNAGLGFAGSPNRQPGNFQGSGYPGSPSRQPGGFPGAGYSGTSGQQQKRRGFGQRKFAQGRNGFSGAQKRGASSGSPYQGNAGGFNDNSEESSPPKKPRVAIRCETCNIDFTSDIPYKMHIAGAKHMKKVKSKEVLETMESQGQAPQAKDNYFYCEHCQVMANSSQQLQMHLDGTKHKNKMRKLSEEANKTEETSKNEGEPVTKEAGPKPAKMMKYYCEVCDLSLNSELQLTQHVASKRHEAKAKGEPLPQKKKPRKFTDMPTNGDETAAAASSAPAPTETTNDTSKESGTTQKIYGMQELGSSFVAGGVLE